MYCFQTQVEVAVAAADGDLNVAVEILMAQKVCNVYLILIGVCMWHIVYYKNLTNRMLFCKLAGIIWK